MRKQMTHASEKMCGGKADESITNNVGEICDYNELSTGISPPIGAMYDGKQFLVYFQLISLVELWEID